MGLKHDIYLSRKPLAGFVAIGASWSVYFAQMPVIKQAVGASDGEYGLAILLGAFGAFGAMWLAPTCQRVAGGLAMALGIAIVGSGMMLAGLSAALWTLTLAMLLASVGSGIVDVLANARVSEIEQDTGRPLMNLNHGLYSFAYAGGAFATGGLRAAGLTPVEIFALLSIAMLWLFWLARDEAPQSYGDDHSKPAGMPVGLVILTGLIVLMAFLTEATTEGWSALHLERTLGGSAVEGAMGPGLLGLMMGIGRMFGHGLTQRISDTSLMLWASLTSSCGVFLASLAPSVPVALLGFAIAGLGISVVLPLAMGLLGRLVQPSVRLAAISRASVIGYGAFFFGPPLMGLIAEGFGLRTAFMVVAALLAVVATTLIPALARRA